MLDTITKVVPLYLAPLLGLASTSLILFDYLSPAVMFHTQVALVTISPGRTVPLPGDKQDAVDGPTISMGLLGSCAQSNNLAPVICTHPSTNPTYNFSVLPNNTPTFMRTPPATTPGWIAVALGLWGVFLILFAASTIGGVGKPIVSRAAAYFGLLGYMIAMAGFLINRLYFGNAVNAFNIHVAQMGQRGPNVQADLSNGFTILWVAFAFAAVPLVSLLTNIHATNEEERLEEEEESKHGTHTLGTMHVLSQH